MQLARCAWRTTSSLSISAAPAAPAPRVARCSSSLATAPTSCGAKRPFLTTVETARDLEDLRVALGADKLTLLGVSYGTMVAREYMRRFPDRTAAVILDSPVPVGPIDVDNLSGLAALPRVLREICATARARGRSSTRRPR